MIISPYLLLRRGRLSDIILERIKTRILCVNNVFFSENRAFCEIMWKYMLEADRSQVTMQHGACTMHGDKDGYKTHSQNT